MLISILYAFLVMVSGLSITVASHLYFLKHHRLMTANQIIFNGFVTGFGIVFSILGLLLIK